MFYLAQVFHACAVCGAAVNFRWILSGVILYRFSVNFLRNLRFSCGGGGALRAWALIDFIGQEFPEKWEIGRCEL
jgi:hypothetical protein